MIENHIKKVKRKDIATHPLQYGVEDNWHWDKDDKSNEVVLYGPDMRVAHFHPKWSNGTAAVRGSKVLNRSSARFYWEIDICERIFGTSMMFGVATKQARLHADSFLNIIGEDQHSFGLSHKGLLWHNGRWQSYTRPFRENESTTIGLLFDGKEGTLTYFKDGISLGIAFTGLNLIEDELFPIISSTAAKTEMTVNNMRREYHNLQDRCRHVILKSLSSESGVDELNLPNAIQTYLRANREEVNANRCQVREQPVNCHKSNTITHFHQSLYSSCDSHNLWNFCNNSSTKSAPFLEL